MAMKITIIRSSNNYEVTPQRLFAQHILLGITSYTLHGVQNRVYLMSIKTSKYRPPVYKCEQWATDPHWPTLSQRPTYVEVGPLMTRLAGSGRFDEVQQWDRS